MSNTEAAGRTSISLPKSLVRRLKVEAKMRKKPASAIVRTALERYFDRAEPEALPPFVGIGASGRRDIAERSEELIARRFRRTARR